MTTKIGFVIDPIETFKPQKDTSFAMMLEAQRRGFEIFIMQPSDLVLKQGCVFSSLQKITVSDTEQTFYQLHETTTQPLATLDVILMRKDPPFDMNYIYTTYLLEHAEKEGVRVINKPASLRDANEKFFITEFPQCCTNTLVSSNTSQVLTFLEAEREIVIKPLDSMGGNSVHHLTTLNKENEALILKLTNNEITPIMAQRFIPEIKQGDKRVLVSHGKPVPFALARIPAKNDFRGNLAQGATAKGQPLTERDHWITEQIGPTLLEKGLLFVGLDIIGDFLTEINVTSPTCVRELDALFDLNICHDFFEGL